MVIENQENHFQKMIIDEERLHTLTKYASTKGVKNKIESDHNPLFCQFSIKYKKESIKKDRTSYYNFKNCKNQEEFFLKTNNSSNLKKIFQTNLCLEQKLELFLQELDGCFASSFQKIRVTTKVKTDSIKELIKVKTSLRIIIKNVVNANMKSFILNKIHHIEQILEEYSGHENSERVKDYVKQLESETGGFNQLGMWKLKSKLCPKPPDPPMAKFDKA